MGIVSAKLHTNLRFILTSVYVTQMSSNPRACWHNATKFVIANSLHASRQTDSQLSDGLPKPEWSVWSYKLSSYNNSHANASILLSILSMWDQCRKQ